MSFTDPDPPEDPDRRALILALGSLPFIGGAFELLGRFMARPVEREAARACARLCAEVEPARPLPFGKAAEATSARQQQDQQRR